jgi:hemolysin activation/secretion protein
MLKNTRNVGNVFWALGLLLALAGARAEPPADPVAGPESADAAQPLFDLFEIRVDGNSVLDSRAVEKTLYPFLGPRKSIDDVENARRALEDTYHKAGYQTVFVNIPEQDVENGLVRMEVAEGKVENLRITGSRYFSLGRIRERVPGLAEGKVPHAPTVQKELSELAQEAKDRRVTPILRAGDTPGTVEAELKVDDQLPLHGSLEMNGRNQVGTSRTRLVASLRYDNLWQRHHSASLQYQIAPERQDVEVWAGTYVMPLFDDAWRLALYGVGVDSVSAVAGIGGLSVLGPGEIYGARLIRPFANWGDYSHALTLGVDYKSFNQITLQGGARLQESPLSYLPFMARYEGTLRVEGQSLTSLGLETQFSVRGLGNEQKEFGDRRRNYLYFVGDLRHQQALPGDLRLAARVSGQVADSPLIAYEQFDAGGDDTVRGYHEVQQLADHGVIGSLELHSPHLAGGMESIRDLRALLFVDGARLWLEEAIGVPARSDLASAGAGVRMQIWRHLTGVFDWAYPFIRSGIVAPGEQRLHFRVLYEF